MLKELKFVQGAVAKKDFIPAITHFAIENGTVRSFNGTVAMSSPLTCDINCKPKAIPMVQAISRCSDTISLSMTPAGRLSIKSGAFKAFIECVSDTDSHVQPEGEIINFDGQKLLDAIIAVQPFIGNDASRPWTNGVLLRDQSAYATNNVCLVQYWIGVEFPCVVNIPRAAIAEMVRINEPPTHAQVCENSITFHYSDGRWIRSQLFETKWADLGRVLNIESNPEPVPEGLYAGLENLRPFCDKFGRVFISEEGLRTHQDSSEGAVYELAWVHQNSIYNIEMLQLLEGTATSADFNRQPCLFFGENLRGAIIGMHPPSTEP
jgi:DNA polymerase III sliding clamp (beta) subunit (PCNA family)